MFTPAGGVSERTLAIGVFGWRYQGCRAASRRCLPLACPQMAAACQPPGEGCRSAPLG